MQINNERVQTVLSLIDGPDVLHVGCVGEGGERFLLHSTLCERLPQCQVWGVDVNASGVAELCRRGFNVVEGDAESLDFDHKFDTIFAGELIEHLSNPGRFLDSCRRALKPNGKLVLSTPNPFSVMYTTMYIKNFRRAFNRGHALWMCPQTLGQISNRSGYTLAEITFVDNICPEHVTSKWSKTFAAIWKVVRPFLPHRFRDTIVAVLRSAK